MHVVLLEGRGELLVFQGVKKLLLEVKFLDQVCFLTVNYKHTSVTGAEGRPVVRAKETQLVAH